MKTTFALVRSRGVAMKSAVATALLAPAVAFAQLPPWAADAEADLSGSISALELMVGGIVVVVTVAIVGIKLFKRFTNKI